MSTEGAMKFGPEWLRALSAVPGGVCGSPPNSPGDAPRYKLADHRYGREEMLALWPRNIQPPSVMVQNNPELVLEKSQVPLLINGLSDEEQRIWHIGINSEPVLRLAGRVSSVERGRGRSRAIPFSKRPSFEEEFNKGRGGVARGRSFERTQSYHERMWGSEQPDDWPGPNKETSRSFKDNWRVPRDREASGEDGWRPTGPPKLREGKSSWRYNSDWGPGGGRGDDHNGRGRGWVQGAEVMDRDALPEWSTENMESMGRFDDTGAFHGTEVWGPREEGNSSSSSQHHKGKEKRKKQGASRNDKTCSSIGESEESSQDDNISDEENNSSSHNERPSPQPQRDKVTVDKSVSSSETLKNQVPNIPLNISVTSSGPSFQDDRMENIVSHLFVDEEAESPNVEAKWYYRDPQGEIQGPFSSVEMGNWYKRGYFNSSLPVRKENSSNFISLGELVKQNGDVPFSPPTPTSASTVPVNPAVVPVPIVSPVPVTTAQPNKVVELIQQQLVQQQQQQQQMLQQQLYQQQQLLLLTRSQHNEANHVRSKLQQMEGWDSLSMEQKQQMIVSQLMSQHGSMPPGVGMSSDPLQQLLGNKPAGLGTLDPVMQQLLGHSLPLQPNPLKDVLAQASVPGPLLKAPEAPTENHLSKDPIQQFLLQMHSNSLFKGAASEEKHHPPVDPIQSLMRQLMQQSAAHTRQEDVKSEEQQLEERRREEEKQKIEAERIRLQEERERFEEMKRQQELRRQEDQRRIEELERIEELRRQEEQRRIQEEEIRKAEEAEREAKRIEEEEAAMRREEQRKKEEQKKKEVEARKALEKKKREEEKSRKEEEKRKREEEELERLRLQELQEEELRREEEERQQRKQLEAKQTEALRRLQEQQMKTKPVWGSSSQASSSFLDIQKMQHDAEKHAAERALRQQQELALQHQEQKALMQQQQQQQEAAKAAKQGWGQRNAPIKSLAEIQAEEADRLAKVREQEKEQEKKASKQSNLPQQAAGIWSSASAKLSWPTPAPAPTNVWGSSSTQQNSPPQGFWDDLPTSKPSAKAKPKNNNNNKNSKSSKERKQEEERLKMVFQSQMQKKQAPHLDEFKKWCSDALSSMKTDVDIPTFVPFLMEVESPYDISDYVKSSIGDTKEAREFTKQFLEKRSRTKNQKGKEMVDDILVPAPANRPSGAFQEVKSKKKGKTAKKNKMEKVDSRLLGFNVTAMSDRVNVGERDFVEGM